MYGATSFAYLRPCMYPDLGYDPIKSFAPVAMLADKPARAGDRARGSGQDGARSSSPTRRPTPASSTSASGSAPCRRSSASISTVVAGIDIVSIPYAGGEQVRADILGGRIHMNVGPATSTMPLIRGKKSSALALHRRLTRHPPASRRAHHEGERVSAGRLLIRMSGRQSSRPPTARRLSSRSSTPRSTRP